jgi:adenylate cyclase
VSIESVPLESIRNCLRGVIPSQITTCSVDGVPNVTTLSIVHYVDSERVALTRQFFNKTSANLRENPWAQIVVVDPSTADQYLLDTQFLYTETEGATFDAVEANLDAIASQTGMTGIFKLRGVDIHRVVECVAFGEIVGVSRHHGSDRDAIERLDEFVRQLSLCGDYPEATRTGLEALADLFGFGQSMLLAADERGDRLFAVASNGYATSAAGAEVQIGVGLIGVAAARRKVVCVPSLAQGRAMHAAMQETLDDGGHELPPHEIPLPGLDLVQSAAAVPLVTHGELVGILYLESERQGEFGPGDERLLRIIGGHLATSLALLQADRGEGTVSSIGSRAASIADAASTAKVGGATTVTYYQADDSVFVDDEYVVKGVPGRILWKLLGEHAAAGRTAFTNRELRLDERLGLPAGNDNLEARLLVLRKRLNVIDCGIGLERVGRGQLELRLASPPALCEVPTTGPMRAAHVSSGPE